MGEIGHGRMAKSIEKMKWVCMMDENTNKND